MMQQSTNILRTPKKPRFLCLHGHLSSATILEQQLKVWPESVTSKMEFVYVNGSVPLDYDDGTSVDQYFGWFDFDKVTMDQYEIIDEGIAYIEDRMIELGPFDGLLGFSEGALISASLPGLQQQGLCLKKVEKIEHVIVISGGGYPVPELTEPALPFPINIPSLHIFGETDIARRHAPELVDAYVDPLVLYHHGGHEVPKLDEEGLRIMYEFLERINAIF
nr:esterase OVCA2-like isoform X2 [Erigeron canadensis]